MEDLIPLIFFLVIVAVNVLKFFIEKGRPKPARGETAPQPEKPQRTPSSLESFFENLAEQMAPKPTELAEWPEGRERPDYAQEMEEFTTTQAKEQEEEHIAEIIPFQAPEPVARVQDKVDGLAARRQSNPWMHSMSRNGKNRSDFRIKGRKNLKQAMISYIIFSPPRALDLSFDNTISK